MGDLLPKHFKPLYIKFITSVGATYKVYPKVSKILKFQTGGGKDREQIVQHIDVNGVHTLRLNIHYDDGDDIVISVLNKDERDCITVLVSNKIAVIQNMSYYNDCTFEGLLSLGGGSILLRFMLNYLLQNKKKYNIKRITLTDTSAIYCKKLGQSIAFIKF